MRENGFQRPYNTMQVGTWILLPLLVVQFLLFVSPVLPVGASVPCTLLFVALGAVSAHQACRCCATNPIDGRLARHLKRQSGENGGDKDGDGGEGGADSEDGAGPTKYCWVCQTNVHDRSMHCKFCDKCVSNFDHHCMWLNTCVGSANYGYFYRTVVSTFLFVLVHSACLAGVVVSYFVQAYGPGGGGGAQVDRMEGWFGAGVPLVVAAVDIVFLVVNVVSLSLVGQLLLFHIGLRREGVTTYEYIVRENQRKRDRSKEAMEVRSKRMVMLRAARGKGDKSGIVGLQAGRICVPCDPARKAVEEDRRREKAQKERKEQAEVVRASSSDEEEGGFHHEEEEEEVKNDDGESEPVRGSLSSPIQPSTPGHDRSSDAPPAEGVAREQPRPGLQEAMASREYHDEGKSSGAGGNGPEFISVGVTECTHPSASNATVPSDIPADAAESKEHS